jgi:hypothetical protein
MPKAFLEPYYNSEDSSLTPAQQATRSIEQTGMIGARDSAALNGIKLSGGNRRRNNSRKNNSKRNNSNKRNNSRRNQRGGGRTLNIPPPIPGRSDLIPGPSFNNGWYIGEPCSGAHCGVSGLPSAGWMINKGLTIGNDVTPGSTTMYPVVDRLGNSFAENLPGLQDYQGTALNPGPFEIKCMTGGRNNSRRNNNNRKNNSRNNRLRTNNRVNDYNLY